jgi:hypothetical protein
MTEQTENMTAQDSQTQDAHPLEKGLDVYPLRDASEDPRWVLRTVWTWVVIAISLLLFFLVLLILGLWYD